MSEDNQSIIENLKKVTHDLISLPNMESRDDASGQMVSQTDLCSANLHDPFSLN